MLNGACAPERGRVLVDPGDRAAAGEDQHLVQSVTTGSVVCCTQMSIASSGSSAMKSAVQ